MILNEEQNMLKDSARNFCGERTPITQLRALRDNQDADGFDRETWAAMVELGWAAIPWPEEVGGLAFGYKGLGVVTEETGRTLTASPLFATVWLGGSIINIGGSDAQKSALLAEIAAGSRLLAVAVDERPRHNPSAISTTAEADGSGGFTINGEKSFVMDGHVADSLIVAARTAGGEQDRNGISLFLVDCSADGVKTTRTIMADSRNAASVTLENVKVSSDALIGPLNEGFAILDQALDIARIGLTAEMLGSLQECFDRTLDYLKEREQFGVLIGTFQALKHRAADMFCEIELARSCVLEALTALDEDRSAEDIAKLASLAKSKVSETFNLVSRESVQMHGGIGMTDEYDAGLFLKRAAVTEATLGDARYHQNRYAELEGY